MRKLVIGLALVGAMALVPGVSNAAECVVGPPPPPVVAPPPPFIPPAVPVLGVVYRPYRVTLRPWLALTPPWVYERAVEATLVNQQAANAQTYVNLEIYSAYLAGCARGQQ